MPKSERDQTMERIRASLERSRKSIAESRRILEEREAERRPRPRLTLVTTDDEEDDDA
jgi:hypothetical protein